VGCYSSNQSSGEPHVALDTLKYWIQLCCFNECDKYQLEGAYPCYQAASSAVFIAATGQMKSRIFLLRLVYVLNQLKTLPGIR
jgi:hypothetical protein